MSSSHQAENKKRKITEINASDDDSDSSTMELEFPSPGPTNQQVLANLNLFKALHTRRSPTLYLEDGSIVLVAQMVAFRVHKSVLAMRSQVFRDMLAVASPEGEDQNVYDQCPMIEVSDTAEQLECLLTHIYQPTQLSPTTPVKTLFHIALLGHKYMIDDLSSMAMKALKPLFPDNFDAWWESEGVTPTRREAFTFEELVYAITVSQTLNCNTMRAITVLLMASKPLDFLLANIRPSSNMLTIIRGREQLSARTCAMIQDSLHSIQTHSPSLPGCNTTGISREVYVWTNLGMFSSNAWSHPGPTPTELRNVLSLASGMLDAIGKRLCPACRDGLKKSARLRTIWKSIPSIFQVTMTAAEVSKWYGDTA